MSRASTTDFLADRLPRSRRRVEALRNWLTVEVDMPRLIEWVDAEVTQRWGKVRAARVLHIMQTGCDCAVEHPLDQAHADLSSALTLVTGNPTSTIDDLIGGRPGRDELEQLTDAQLLRRTARELAMAVDGCPCCHAPGGPRPDHAGRGWHPFSITGRVRAGRHHVVRAS